MPKHEGVFVPHKHCRVHSGDCFTEGKCLEKCTARQKVDHEKRITELERRVNQLMNACIRHGIKL